jgi:hypothetical protein
MLPGVFRVLPDVFPDLPHVYRFAPVPTCCPPSMSGSVPVKAGFTPVKAGSSPRCARSSPSLAGDAFQNESSCLSCAFRVFVIRSYRRQSFQHSIVIAGAVQEVREVVSPNLRVRRTANHEGKFRLSVSDRSRSSGQIKLSLATLGLGEGHGVRRSASRQLSGVSGCRDSFAAVNLLAIMGLVLPLSGVRERVDARQAHRDADPLRPRTA